MPDYRITIDVRDVTTADVTDVAQKIWDEHADDLDARLGDFKLVVTKTMGSSSYLVDWHPDGEETDASA